MPIDKTPFYVCDSCSHSSANPFQFRIIEGAIKMGNQTLIHGYDFKPEVLCIECFCGTMGLNIDNFDMLSEDDRFKHIDPSYTGEDKGRDTFNDKPDFDDLDVPNE